MERRRTWCVSETCSIPQILPADGIDVRRTRSNGDAFLNLNQTFCSSPNLQSAISRSGWKRFNTVLHEAATSEHSICIGRLLRAVSFGVMVPSSAGFMLDKHGPLTDMPSNFCTMSGCQLKAQPRSPCTYNKNHSLEQQVCLSLAQTKALEILHACQAQEALHSKQPS